MRISAALALTYASRLSARRYHAHDVHSEDENVRAYTLACAATGILHASSAARLCKSARCAARICDARICATCGSNVKASATPLRWGAEARREYGQGGASMAEPRQAKAWQGVVRSPHRVACCVA